MFDRDWTNEPENVRVEPWYGLGQTPEEQPWLVSATDLLIDWKPEPNLQSGLSSGTPDLWDHYFRPPGPKPVQSVPAPEPVEKSWDPASAEAAVDCLFRFIHALERSDVEEAMNCVSEEYHTFEYDCEFDAHALRLRLEGLMDVWRGEDIQLSLSEVPDPVFHPVGILIQITLQVDYYSKLLGRRNTELIPGVIVLHQTPDFRWLIAAWSPVN